MEGWKVWDEVAQLLEEEKSIEKPHDLLTSPDRQVEALIELGCVYRDLLRFLMRELRATIDDRGSGLARRAAETATDYGLLRYLGPEEAVEVAERARRALLEGLKEKLKGLGEQTLLDAAARAEKAGLLYRRMEALVNLAWLYYYLDQQDRGGEVRRILEEAEQTLPSEYEVGGELWRVVKDEKRKAEERDKVILPFLIQKGKAELLRGQIAFNKYQYADGGDKALEEAIRHYFLSLAYDSAFFDHSFRDMRRGMDRIYERLCQLGPRRLRQVWGWTIDLEDNYDLKTQVIDEETGERGSRFRRFLRDSFGPPEHLYEISED
ncbi:MAG TPA: hypothetical protein ENK08_11970 [Chloroflexi bacterium]|nr:hypothetical protein [Chloroflexota bacterium]